ncbi:MAG: Do family serine endopeptidase [Bacteroidota bacterium]
MKKYGLLIGCSILSALLAVFVYRLVEPPQEVIVRETIPARYTNFSEDQLSELPTRTFLSSSPTNFTSAAQSVTPAVVNIKTSQGGGSFDFFSSASMGTSTGSGVIISPDGYIVTNNHVIEDGEEVSVTLNDKRELEAEIIGVDPSTDLALLKVDARRLPHIQFGNSDSLLVGEWVLAVGNPFNLESTVTAGIVSAKGRSIDILEGQDRIESFIQTDAAVNPGNSGGALVNTNGELIGINTAIITRSGRYEGYSFAVPANLVRKVIRDLRDFGIVQRGILGVFIDEMNSELAADLGLNAVEGVYIKRVTPGSGADEAGLKKGDVIVGINTLNIKTMPQMQEQLGQFRPGNTITIQYIRRGKRKKAKVTLKNRSNSTSIVTAKEEDVLRDLGFELRNLTKEERIRLDTEGVKVISIYRGSKIERTNMDPGYIITHVDSDRIDDVDQFIQKLKGASGKIMLEGIYENYPGEYYYAFSLE